MPDLAIEKLPEFDNHKPVTFISDPKLRMRWPRKISMGNDLLMRLLESKVGRRSESRPQIFNIRKPGDRRVIARLLASRAIQHVADDYEEQLREHFAIQNAALYYTPHFEDEFKKYLARLRLRAPLIHHGRWIYFAWSSTLVHILEDEIFQIVRTNRNRNLVTADEQKKFYDTVIGIAGLSVGNSVALSIVLQGGGRHLRLADYDHLALSNTNRIRTGVGCLGLPKVEMTARQIYELNPYAKLDLFPDGLTEKNIRKFFEGPPKLDIVVDEVDNLAIKYRIREYARKFRIPVLMGTDNGDNALMDIERYDLNPKTPFFHGRAGIGEKSYEELRAAHKLEAGKLIAKHVGPENVTPRMQESLSEIGKTLVSWPQLGGAALLNGLAIASCIRRIANGQPIISDRAFVSLDDVLIPGYTSPRTVRSRQRATRRFINRLGL